MTQQMQMNEQLTVGGQPSLEELRQLADEGFRTIVNLRTEGEEDQPLSPEEEGTEVRQLGMEYVHFPVDKEQMNEELENEFRERLGTFSAPVFVHCSSGKRAGAFVVMDQAIGAGWSGEETLQKAEEMGFECKDTKIRDFVKNYVNSHS